MKLAMIGLGKMGANMTRRLVRDGHEVVAYDVSADAVSTLANEYADITGVTTPAGVIASLAPPRVIWLMVPHRYVDQTIDAFLEAGLEAGDLLVDSARRYTLAPICPNGAGPQ